MDKSAITDLIKELIEKMAIPVSNISVEEDSAGKGKTFWFRAEVGEPHFFIGRNGEALFALSHLVRRIIESKTTPEASAPESSELDIVVDINDFQKRRVDNVRAVAHMMAERARYFKSNIEVDPMPPFERRIVHEFLSEATDLKTESQGVGPTRRVVIKYLGSL